MPIAARLLHVANGSSTTGTIRAANIPGATSIWADPLYEGPVPAGLTDAELVETRARFLAGPGAGSAAEVANGLRGWRRVIDDCDTYDELVLWFEHDLFDQLNLIQLLSFIQDRLPIEKSSSLICIGSFPGRPGFKGLGELTPSELAPLVETRQPVSDAQFVLATQAWNAFREPTPEGLARLRQSDTTALPYLANAVARFFQEYPWTSDGLSRSERRLLTLAAAGELELSAAFPRMHEGEASYYITDVSLMAIARGLAGAAPPLLAFARPPAANGHILDGTVVLTDEGRAVLSGQQDRVTLCGIDRWLGGVHLRTGVPLWRWDADGGRVTRTS